jgi:putative ABC transport system substrate-binding protein
MNRRECMTWLGTVAIAAAAPVAMAQQSSRVFRVGHLSALAHNANKTFVDAFLGAMRSLGYVEKQNLVFSERYAEGKVDRLGALAKELIGSGCDVLLASTTPGNLAAKAAARTLPIVMVLIADPVGAGIVPNLQKPGGNITGVTNIIAELAGKRLEFLKEIVPNASRVAVFLNSNDQNVPLQMRYAEAAARNLKIDLKPVVEIRMPSDLKAAFDTAAQAGVQGVLRLIDPLAFTLRQQTAALAVQYRLPMMHVLREDVEAGGLAAYGADVAEQYRRAATFVDKILKGARPGDLPVEQPTKFELVVNQKAARAIGLTIPQSVLLRADAVVG